MIVFAETYNSKDKLYIRETLYRTIDEVKEIVDNIDKFNMENVCAITVNINTRKIISTIKHR